MAEVFSLQDIYGAPVSIVDINYEFNFLGENTRLIGVKTVSYPPIDDALVEKEVEEFDEDTWWSNLGKGILATVGLAVLGVAVILTAPASVPAIVTGCIAGCAIGGAVGAGVTTAVVAYNDRKSGEVTSSEAFNQMLATGVHYGMRIGAEIGMMAGGFIDTVNGLKAAVEILSQLSAGGFGMSLATDAGISISIGGASLEGAITLEQLAQLGIGIVGVGAVSSSLNGLSNDIKFSQSINGRNISSGELKEIYNSIKESPNYPEGFQPRKSGTTSNKVNNERLLEKLRKIESGTWKKVYKDGYDVYGNKISIHYFQSQSGKVFDVKVKFGWSN